MKWTDGRTNRRYQTYYLPSLAVDKQSVRKKISIIQLQKMLYMKVLLYIIAFILPEVPIGNGTHVFPKQTLVCRWLMKYKCSMT